MKKILMITLTMIFLLILSGCNGFQVNQELSITLKPNVDTIEVFSHYEDTGATARYVNEIVEVIVVENTVNTNLVGVYMITYQATHNDLTVEAHRIVVVIDTTPPIMILKAGIDTIKVGQDWHDSGVDVSDNYDSEITVITSGSVDISVIGSYTITYTARDSFGNESQIIRIVEVI